MLEKTLQKIRSYVKMSSFRHWKAKQNPGLKNIKKDQMISF